LDHFLAFGVLAWLADGSFPGRKVEPYRCALLLAYGLGIELVQGHFPHRDPSFLDFAANAAGVFSYSIAARVSTIKFAQSD
jgi:hypothetical protein